MWINLSSCRQFSLSHWYYCCCGMYACVPIGVRTQSMASLPSGVKLAVYSHFCLGSSIDVFVRQGVWLKGNWLRKYRVYVPRSNSVIRRFYSHEVRKVALLLQQLTFLLQCVGHLKLLLLSCSYPSRIIYVLEANTRIVLVSFKVLLDTSCLYCFSLGKDMESKWTELRNMNHVY